MPYSPHDVFKQPSSMKARIWRYMNLAKFASLLHRESLFFVRADKLADIDPYEGSFARPNVALDQMEFSQVPDDARQTETFPFKDEKQWKKYVEMMRMSRRAMKRMLHKHAINCWHLNEHESAAMWSLYDKSGEGVAVVSTFESLCKSFDQYDDAKIFIGEVNYIDYESEAIPEDNIYNPLMYKRKSFEHEKEIRALVTPHFGKGHIETEGDWLDFGIEGPGLYVRADLSELIHAIYVSPSAQEWVVDVIQNITEKYGIDKAVQKSVLNDPGLF